MKRRVKSGLLYWVIGFTCLSLVKCTTTKSTDNSPAMKDHPEPAVSAELMFLSAEGEDPIGKTITSDNIRKYLPDTRSVDFLIRYFEEQQIQLNYYAGITATLTGSRERFEALFRIRLREDEGIYALDPSEAASADPTILPMETLPEEVQSKISVITLPPKPDIFR